MTETIVELGFLNEIYRNELWKVYHEKWFQVYYLGTVPEGIRGDRDKIIEWMIEKRWIRRRSGSPTATA